MTGVQYKPKLLNKCTLVLSCYTSSLTFFTETVQGALESFLVRLKPENEPIVQLSSRYVNFIYYTNLKSKFIIIPTAWQFFMTIKFIPKNVFTGLMRGFMHYLPQLLLICREYQMLIPS